MSPVKAEYRNTNHRDSIQLWAHYQDEERNNLSPSSTDRRCSGNLKQTVLNFSPVSSPRSDVTDLKSVDEYTPIVSLRSPSELSTSLHCHLKSESDCDKAKPIHQLKSDPEIDFNEHYESPSADRKPKKQMLLSPVPEVSVSAVTAKRKPGKSKDSSVRSRNQSSNSRCARNEHKIHRSQPKSVSVSPRKSLAKDLTVDGRRELTDKKRQTQLTTLGIRRTARQFAKEMEREREANTMWLLQNNVERDMKIVVTDEKGRGIVATRTFTEGEFVVEYAGELISEKVAKVREAKYKQDPSIGSYMFFFVHAGQRFCVDATKETSRLGRLINHSRLHPNCAVKVIPVENIPRLVLFTMKTISPGEELLYDYGDRDKESLELHPWLKT